MRTPTWLAVLRDLLLMGLGGVGLVREILTGRDPGPVWGVYLLMIAGTGVLNAAWLVRNSPTGGPPPSPPGLPSSPPSPISES